jgi:cystathionine gamma-synthase/methionine-gamma-lyase
MKAEHKRAVEDSSGHSIETELAHAGENGEPVVGKPVAMPIYATTTFTYDTMAEVDAVFAGDEQGYAYTRYGNPTVRALECALETLEGGAGACAYGSGMAALHAALLACDLAPGSTVLAAQDLYGTTTHLLDTIFRQFGVRTVPADFNDAASLRTVALETRPQVLICETISNPLLKVCDLEMCAGVAREAGARLIVDNTFASPYLCQPLKHGADIVVHSMTKYLGGHGDATGGICVAADEQLHKRLTAVRNTVGGVLSVWEAHEILRGVKTLAVRMERQCENARRLAEHLLIDRRVARVYHPGFGANAAQGEVARRMLRPPHTGALVSVELAENTREAAYRFMDALRLCVRLTSLGDVVTCVLHPPTASHRSLTPERREEIGITDGLVRVSVGIEDAADIIRDIERALETVEPARSIHAQV